MNTFRSDLRGPRGYKRGEGVLLDELSKRQGQGPVVEGTGVGPVVEGTGVVPNVGQGQGVGPVVGQGVQGVGPVVEQGVGQDKGAITLPLKSP